MNRDIELIQVIVISSIWLVFATAVFGQDIPPKPNTTYEKYLVAKVPLPSGIDLGLERKGRFSDMAISPDGTKAWLCDDLHSKRVCGFDVSSGKALKCFGKLSGPLIIHYHPASKRLYVVDVNRHSDQNGVIVRTYDPSTGKQDRSIPIPDWRLYRVASAAFSPDGGQMWLVSSPTSSSRYGQVSAAIFRIDLRNGKWRQLYGPRMEEVGNPLRREVLAYPENPSRILRVAMDSSGRVFAINLKHRFLSVFPTGADKPKHEYRLDFVPSHLCHAGKGKLLIAGKGRIIVLDTKTMKVQRAAYVSGAPTAVCTDSAGKRAFVAMDKSADVLVMNTARTDPVRFAQPIHLPMANIDRIFFLDNPERLIGICHSGYEPFVLNLATGAVITRRVGIPLRARRLRIDHRTHTATVTLAPGRIGIINLEPGGTARTILAGNELMDVVFTGDDTVLVSDVLNKRLLSVDLARGRALGHISLENYPYGLALGGDGRSIGVVFGYRDAPNTAVIDLIANKARYYANRKELPVEWKDLHERASGSISRGENAGVSIRIFTWADVATVVLRLSNGREAIFTLPGRCVAENVSVAIGTDEKFAYVLSDPQEPVLLKFRLGPAD